MKIKRLTALAAAALMVCAAAGCGTKDTGSGGTTGKVSTDAVPEAKYNGKENPYAKLDLKGESIRIAAPWEIKPEDEGSSTAATLQWERIKYLEKKYNCKFEWNISGDTDKLTSSVAAGAPYADFLCVYTSTIPSLAVNGYLQNMDSIKSVDLNESKWNSGNVSMGAFNNGHYSFAIGKSVPRYVIAFNKTMFEKNGWESPYELYKKDNWTWDKMLEIATKATDKTAGRYGLGGMELLSDSIRASYGGSFVTVDGSGVPKFTGDSAECQQAVQLVRDIGSKYDICWTPETFTWQSPVLALSEGKVAMAATQLYLIRENILDMEDDYGLVPVPKGSNAKGRYASVSGDVPTYVMPANNPLAQEKAYILDLFTEPYPGYEDIISRAELETYCRDEDSVDIMLDVEKKYNLFEMGIWFTKAGNLYGEAISSVTSGKATFAEAMGKSKAQIEQSIADVYASWSK